jgi:hypothetical protein
MVQQDKKKHPSSFKPSNSFSEVQEAVNEIERDTMDTILRGTDDFTRAASEGLGMCSGNMNALVESGTNASRIFQETSKEMIEGYNRTLSVCSELSMEAMGCRTISDMMELQKSAVQQLCENYVATANNLYEMLSDSCEEAMSPFIKHSTNSRPIRKTKAA